MYENRAFSRRIVPVSADLEEKTLATGFCQSSPEFRQQL
jgi:hypothetical protein